MKHTCTPGGLPVCRSSACASSRGRPSQHLLKSHNRTLPSLEAVTILGRGAILVSPHRLNCSAGSSCTSAIQLLWSFADSKGPISPSSPACTGIHQYWPSTWVQLRLLQQVTFWHARQCAGISICIHWVLILQNNVQTHKATSMAELLHYNSDSSTLTNIYCTTYAVEVSIFKPSQVSAASMLRSTGSSVLVAGQWCLSDTKAEGRAVLASDTAYQCLLNAKDCSMAILAPSS